MTTYRNRHEFWTETKRVVQSEGQPVVKQVTCCCDAPADSAWLCSSARGCTSRCRCDCHTDRVDATICDCKETQ